MVSMKERATCAMLRFYGRLADMPRSRLANFLFRKRCEEVDQGGAALSWCSKAKAWLEELGWGQQWRTRAVLPRWPSLVRAQVRRHLQADVNIALLAKSSLETFRQLGYQPLQAWRLDRVARHPGALLRVKLRAGGAPLMMAVGSRAGIPRELRTCRICGGAELETAEHFVSKCPVYAGERQDCLRRLRVVLDGHNTPLLLRALDNAAVRLFLSDSLMRRLPEEVARRAEATICDFLMVAWRRRCSIWQNFVVAGDDWKLRV